MTADEKTLGEQMTTWQIGESGTELVLDGDGEGEVTFTVTNASEAQDRAVLTITPLDGATDSWFTVDEPQRAVGPGASVVYAVKVKVPPGTAAGSFGMQGVAYSADTDPSESSVTSKRVGITVPPPPPKKGIPKWIYIVIAAVLLLIIGLIAFFLTRGGGGLANEEPPTIVEDPVVLQTATADPGVWSEEELAFEFQWQRCDRDGDDCEDIDGATQQTFVPGAQEANLTLRVEVTATSGDDTATAASDASEAVVPVDLNTVPVPPVISLTRSQATAALTAAGFIVEQEEQGTSTGECDPVVLDQRPPRDTLLAQAETVTIITRPAVINIRACDLGDFDDQIRLPIRVEDGIGPIPEEFTRIIVEEAQ